jgi:large subunit ribosomal protein L4
MNIEVLNNSGEKVREVKLIDDIASCSLNKHLVYVVVKGILNNSRKAHAKVKTRGEVRGGGRKPFRQKGTGRARQGSIRSPLLRGGGVTFGPTQDRNYKVKINKKERKRSLSMVLKELIKENRIKIVDFSLKEIKTKEFLKILKNLKLDKEKVGLVLAQDEEIIQKSARNLPNVLIYNSSSLNTYNALNCYYLLFSENSFLRLQERWKKN